MPRLVANGERPEGSHDDDRQKRQTDATRHMTLVRFDAFQRSPVQPADEDGLTDHPTGHREIGEDDDVNEQREDEGEHRQPEVLCVQPLSVDKQSERRGRAQQEHIGEHQRGEDFGGTASPFSNQE